VKIILLGGTGSVGHILTEYLLPNHEITIYSRNENLQWQMKQQYPKCRYIIGDIRDYDALYKAIDGQEIVILLAALKHVSFCEDNPLEARKTNVEGAYNVMKACCSIASVKKTLYFNSDKSIDPICVYGYSKKRAAEIWNDANIKKPIFSEIICGNILNSSGSVLQIYRRLIEKGITELPVSDPEVERYFVTENQVCEMVQAFLDLQFPERIATQPMRIRIRDLVEALGCAPVYNGLSDKEKLKEGYACECEFETIEEIQEVIAEAWGLEQL
jgi:UDP-N-acetylglucosamine 4,6-dehydratase